MKTGLIVGRFQPFHLGHLSAIKQALKKVDKLYIAIGSSQYDHESYNPFTGEERREMVERALEEADLKDKCEIFLVPDIHDDAKWTEHVRKIVPPFDKIFVGNNSLVKELFNMYDTTPVIDVEHKLDISATKIRSAIVKGLDWEKHVSPTVAAYLKEIDGIERIRKL